MGLGYVYEEMNIDGIDLKFRLRADEDKKIGQHLNDETIFKIESPTGKVSGYALDNLHHLLDWMKK